MTKLRSFHSYLPVLAKVALFCLSAGCFADGQILDQEQEFHVHDLKSLMARTHDPADILLTSLDTIIHDKEVCCGKDSALEDSAQASDPKSLKDVANKLQGRHLLSDGRPIKVTADYIAPDQVNSALLVNMILNQHAALFEWNDHVYVLEGVAYIWEESGPDSGAYIVIRKFLLLDTRFSDSRRQVTFTRGVDDASKVQGLLFVQSARLSNFLSC